MMEMPLRKRPWIRRTLRWAAVGAAALAVLYLAAVALLVVSFAYGDWSF